METIICTLCATEKPLNEFYKNSGMPNGHASQCKNCVKARARRREERLKADSEWIEKERQRGREKYHRLNYKDNKPNPEVRKKAYQNYKEKYPEKIRCQKATSKIKTRGEKHHWNYNIGFEKDFIELSVESHNLLHRYMKYDQERLMFRSIINLGNFIEGELLDTKYRHLEYFKLINNKFN